MTTVRVMVVDDHAVVRDGIRALLVTRPDIEVVADAADGEDAVRLAGQLHPQVVLMDLSMPRMDGVEATRRMGGLDPAPAVLVLTMSDTDASLRAAVRAGARGYLLKHATGEQLISSILAVVHGQAVFGTEVATAVLARVQAPPEAGQLFPELTAREREVLQLLSGGHGNHALAARLGVSAKTVANTVSSILAKLGVTTRADAARIAREAGLTPSGD